MIAVALKGLLRCKTRAILSGLAIVLGVGMVSGTFIFTDTIQKAFDGVFASPSKHTTVVVTGRQVVTGVVNTPTVPATLLTRVRAAPGVEAAAGGFLFDTVKLIGRDGRAIGDGAPQFGFGIDAGDSRFSPLALAAGSWATGPGQIVIGSATAAKAHYVVGDRIGARGDGPAHQYTISGLATVRGVSVGSATIAAFDVPTAHAILDQSGRYDSISVVAKNGTSPAALAAKLGPLLAATAEVRTADEQSASDMDSITGATSTIRVILLAFAAAALFVGAFVIFNTISMTVAQRTREFATLRTLGASRRQVMSSVLLKSAAIGAVASVFGLLLGYGLAQLLNVLVKGLPQTGTVVAPRTVIVSFLVGVGVSLLAGFFPALRATGVPPISAVREGAVLPTSKFARYKPYAAGGVVLVSIVAIALGVFSGGDARTVLVPDAAATLLLFIAIAMASSYLIRPLVRIVGLPARRLGGSAGRLAAAKLRRNPSRTAATAAALMIGLALPAFVATLAAGLESSTKDDLGKQVKSDYIVLASESSNSGHFDTATEPALTTVPRVTTVSAVRTDKARVLGGTTSVAGIEGKTIARVYHFAWNNGSDAVLAHLGNAAIIDSTYARKHHLSIGSPLAVETPAGTSRTFVVRATYHPSFQEMFPGILIDRSAFGQTIPRPQNIYSFVNAADRASPGTTVAMNRNLRPFTEVRVMTTPAWIQRETDSIKSTLTIFYAFLALSVIVSLLGMVNTLVLSVFERTREIGMLRAVGMSTRQLRRMIGHESIITALIGAALGLPLGLVLAAILTRGLSSQGVSFHIPTVQLISFALLALLAGVWAAVLPARGATRLDVLKTLQYE